MAKKKRKKAKKPVKRFKKQRQARKKNIKKRRIISGRKRSTPKKIRRKNPVKRRAGRKKPARRKIIKRPKPQAAAAPRKTHEEPKAVHAIEEKPRAEKPHISPAPKAPGIKVAVISIAVAAALALLGLFYVNVNKCGEASAVIASVSYESEKARETREGRPGKPQDQMARHINIIKEAAVKSGMKKAEQDYFAGHFTSVISSSVQPRKNDIALGVVYAEKTVKIAWFRSRACAVSKTRPWLSSRPEHDKKKMDAFKAAADVCIPDLHVRQQAVDYYSGPVIELDLAGDAAPYYLYYLSYVIVFENYPSEKGAVPVYPPVAGGDPAEFLGMDGLFKIFEKKAEALTRLDALIESAAMKKMDTVAVESTKKAAAEISAIADALDMETAQKLVSTALLASLPAQQWAKMENSKLKRPWFETTYEDELDKGKAGRFLSRMKSAKKFSDAEKKLVAASALMLYKTSRCMRTFTWSKNLAVYSENYRLAHAILMHYINSYDAALCKKLGDELDRYYAGRYYGTVNR